MSAATPNVAASVRARLLNVANSPTPIFKDKR